MVITHRTITLYLSRQPSHVSSAVARICQRLDARVVRAAHRRVGTLRLRGYAPDNSSGRQRLRPRLSHCHLRRAGATCTAAERLVSAPNELPRLVGRCMFLRRRQRGSTKPIVDADGSRRDQARHDAREYPFADAVAPIEHLRARRPSAWDDRAGCHLYGAPCGLLHVPAGRDAHANLWDLARLKKLVLVLVLVLTERHPTHRPTD